MLYIYIYIERKVHKIVLYPTFYCCNAFHHLGWAGHTTRSNSKNTKLLILFPWR